MVLRREVVESELDFVPRAKLKSALRNLERHPTAGKPLRRALAGCRSIRIEGAENRLVYRVGVDAAGQFVEVLAIGRRRDDEVYSAAAARAADE